LAWFSRRRDLSKLCKVRIILRGDFTMGLLNNILEVVPESVRNQINEMYQQGCELYENARNQYLVFEGEARVQVRNLLPESVQPLALKVVDSFVETIAGLAIVSDFGRPLAGVLWAVRAVEILTPLAKTLMDGQIEKEALDKALAEMGDHLQGTIERCKPAMLVSCAVASVFYTVSGFITLSPDHLFQGSLFALAAAVAHQSMDLRAAGGAAAPQPAGSGSKPAVPASSSSS
jgi:hypothetical protein